MTVKILAATAAALVVLWAAPTPAQVAHGDECGVAATPLSFGAYSVFSTQALDSTAEVRIACNSNRTIRISLSQGSHGTYLERGMARSGGPEQLRYQVFTDQTRQVPWGNGTSGTRPVIGAVHTGRVVFVMYARVAAQQSVPSGYYTDQLTVTISF